jgi:hypothetical protein
MIIGKFKTNHPFMIGLLLIMAVLLWLDGFVYYRQINLTVEGSAPLYFLLANFFQTYKWLSVILSFLFMLLQAFMLNRVIADKNLVDRNSWLPALMYIVLMSSSFNLFGLHPIWFANFFLIIATDKMFEVFKEESVNVEIFNVAFFISVASLFYFPAIIFIFLLIATLIIYYLINIREFFASFIGLFLPYLFLALYYYWHDMLSEKIEFFTGLSINVRSLFIQIVPYGWFSIIVVGIIGLISISRIYLGALLDKPIRIRKRFQVLLAYLIISVAGVFFAGSLTNIHHGIIMLPLSAIIAGFFQENKKILFSEIIFSSLLILILLGKLARL